MAGPNSSFLSSDSDGFDLDSTGVDVVDGQTVEAIKSVANKLAVIGDELCQSYEQPCYSGVSVLPKPCVSLRCTFELVVFLVKVVS